MNILLIQPEFKKAEKAYPLGLSQLGAVLKNRGHKVYGLDLSFSGIEDVKDIITNEKIDIVNVSAACYGISLMAYSLTSAIPIVREIRRLFRIPVVINGPFTTAFGMDDDFDSLPFSDRELFPLEKYRGMLTKEKKYTQVVTSRGCNHKCSYCPEPGFYGCWQGRSLEKVVSEIKSISDKYKIKEFHIEDANFFGGGSDRIKDFCKKLSESKLKISWQCPNGIPPQDISDLSVFPEMAKTGCYSICLGAESFDKDLQRSMSKFCDPETLKKIVAAAHRAGIEVTGYFMIGLPGQDLKSIRADIKLSRTIGFDFVNYTIFRPYPGSLWSSHPSGIKDETLKQLRRKAYLLNSLQLPTLKFALRSFWRVKQPLKFFSRVINCIYEE